MERRGEKVDADPKVEMGDGERQQGRHVLQQRDQRQMKRASWNTKRREGLVTRILMEAADMVMGGRGREGDEKGFI